MSTLLDKNAPRLVIWFTDVLFCILAVFIAYELRFNFSIPEVERITFPLVFTVVAGIRALSYFIFKTYQGIIRYTSTRDAVRILIALAAGSAVMVILNLISFQFTEKYIVPFSIIIIEFLLTTFLMVTARLLVKVLYQELKNPTSAKTGVLIYGAGEAGLITKRTLDRDRGTRYKVVAFVDDDPKKQARNWKVSPYILQLSLNPC